MHANPTQDIGGVFSRSWRLLCANWIIIVPAVVISAAAGLLNAALMPSYAWDPASGLVYHSTFGLTLALAIAIAAFVGLIASVLSMTVTTGMADAAWRTGRATLGDGLAVLGRPNVTAAMFALFGISLVLSLLTFATIGLASIIELVVFFFLVYALAAAVVGGFGGAQALKESFEVAKSSWQTTLIVIVLLGVVGVLAGIVAGIFHFVPLLGPIVGGAVQGAVVGFFSLVLVGEYISLRGDSPAA